MAKLIELNLRPEPRTLRQFGLFALVGFGLLALAAWKERALFAAGLGGARVPVTAALLAVGVISAVLALVRPQANRPLYVTLSVVSFPIGFLLSYVILGVLFFVVFGVVALVMRVLGRDPMHRRYDRAAASYWVMPGKDKVRDSYFRQF
jgi:hypothetical protein